jgi:neutral ceramidase
MRKLLRFLVVMLALLAGLAWALVAPVDRTPYAQTAYYQHTMNDLAHFWPSQPAGPPVRPGQLRAGWAKVNITPAQPGPLAGYGISRGDYERVHDSLYVRAIYLATPAQATALVSIDLAVFPPSVVAALPDTLPGSGLPKNQVYWMATHTHNGAGGWADQPAGRLLAGRYDPAVVANLARAVSHALAQAQARAQPARAGYGEVGVPAFVHHRLLDGGPVDPTLRLLKLEQTGGASALLVAYQAHPTCTDPTVLDLGRDYPGYLVDALEGAQPGQFAMFAAGMVASHAPRWAGPGEGYPMAQHLGQGLAQAAQTLAGTVPLADSSLLRWGRLPLDLGEPQLRLTDGWRVRPGVFDALLGERQLWAQVLQVNDLLMVGLPCDFSGEFMAQLGPLAKERGRQLLITSFNGGYTGYITPDHYYDTLCAPEIREMNWVGPGKGAFFLELIREIITKT